MLTGLNKTCNGAGRAHPDCGCRFRHGNRDANNKAEAIFEARKLRWLRWLSD